MHSFSAFFDPSARTHEIYRPRHHPMDYK